jgi:nitronate monooxygenase
MRSPLSDLNLNNPVMAAPMAGGPSNAAYVNAVARTGSLGFLAAGYKTPEVLAEQIDALDDQSRFFGVNLFVPNPLPVDLDAFRRYAASIQTEADRYGIDLRHVAPHEDDDFWQAKIDLLLAHPVPVVSFTFGIPDAATIAALRKVGTITVQTVTSVDEARLAVDGGVDVVAVQANAAGGHSGTLTPQRLPAALPLQALVAMIRDRSEVPIIAAGGLSTAAEVATIMHSGADAVMVGTMLLRSQESGASAVHKDALAVQNRGDTVVTRAFTGRPARALPNSFITAHDAEAPFGYPAIHHLTGALRRAAIADGNPELINLWAGTGYRNATAEPVAVILDRLAQGI